MACTHTAAMAVLSRIGGAHGGDRHVAMMAAATSKILRAYAMSRTQLERRILRLLHSDGMGILKIGKTLGVGTALVQRVIHQGPFAEAA